MIATFGLLVTTLMVWSEQQQTSLALDRETQQRQLAEQSFRQARLAVDTFNNLSESELAYRPELQDLRRSLLETSLTFYSDFLEQRKDDPELAVDLATTSARVERMVDELRVLDNIAPLLLLISPDVQAELAIETIEADEITMSVSRFQSDRRGLTNQNVGGITSENMEMTDLLQELDSHIHIMVKQNGREVLTTQLMIRGHEGNARDGIFREAGDLVDRELVMGDFKSQADSKIGELACSFDIVLGRTPGDRQLQRR